jgi:hypothetical protein
MFGFLTVTAAIVTFFGLTVGGELSERGALFLTVFIWIPIGSFLIISILITNLEFRHMGREFHGAHYMRVGLTEDEVSGRISRSLREGGYAFIETRGGA